MDKQYVLKIWSSPKETLTPHWKKITCGLGVALGLVIIGVIYSYSASVDTEATPLCDTPSSPSYEIPDTCPWQLVMSDLTHRLRLLEMAFKEQVIAREVMAAEVTNQSSSNLELEKKLEDFLTALRNLSVRLDKMNDQMSELTSRLYSDECLGFLVLLFIAVEIILAVRAKMHGRQGQGQSVQAQAQNGSTVNVPKSLSNNSINGAPVSSKQNVSFRQDICVVTFSKLAWKQNSVLAETLLTYVTDDVRIPIKQSHFVDSPESIKECPKAKLYIVLVDCDGIRHDCLVEKIDHPMAELDLNLDLQLLFLRQMKIAGGHVILVLTNEEGSKKLPSLSLYNTGLSVIQSNDVLQELASNGRVLSIWNDFSTHQIAHVKKIGKSLLNLKGK